MNEWMKQVVILFTYVLSSYCLERMKLCEEISTFFPNFCTYDLAHEYCYHLCNGPISKKKLLCGHDGLAKSSQRKRRIIGGTASMINQWKWHISLRLNNRHQCGGSILSQHFVVTAAHCVDKNYTSDSPDNFTVVVGTNYRNTTSPEEQRIQVKRIITHEVYTPQNYPRLDANFWVVKNDIAILELKDAIRLYDDNKASICVPDKNNLIPDNSTCYIVGWGFTKFEGKGADLIRHAEIKIVSNDVCNKEISFNKTVNKSITICAGDVNATVSPCNGDSGGGLVCKKNGTWYLNGIISSGYKCGGPYAYSLYANVNGFKKWILQSLLTSTSNASIRCTYQLYLLVVLYLFTVIILHF